MASREPEISGPDAASQLGTAITEAQRRKARLMAAFNFKPIPKPEPQTKKGLNK